MRASDLVLEMVAYQRVTLLFSKCARDVAKPCQTRSRILRGAEGARRVYGLSVAQYRKSGGDGDLASNNHYGELTRYSPGIQLGTSTVLKGVKIQGECNETYAFTCWTGRTWRRSGKHWSRRLA
jgi:hypothetical protein